MSQEILTDEDKEHIRKHGLTEEELLRQLDLFRMSAPYMKLVRPCAIGDGIKVIRDENAQTLIEVYDREVPKRHCVKFVPASGAASRMFDTLLGELNKGKDILKHFVEKEAQAGNKDRQELLKFMLGIKRFVFFEDLKTEMSKEGFRIEDCLKQGNFTPIIRCLLTEPGLNYAVMPKALIKFHEYSDGNRTAFEEHLVEAASYAVGKDRQCYLHFTVSPEHLERFHKLLKDVRQRYEQRYQASFQVAFSIQKKSTDTLAVDMDNKPFRDENGRLLLRPGGHGSLIENLNDLHGDIIFIKNIDNVVPDRLKSETVKWKKILGGYLLSLQKQISNFIEKLSSGIGNGILFDEVRRFLRQEFFMALPPLTENMSSDEKRTLLLDKLNRPVRVCGMVKNEGEPGGGPFWVREKGGECTAQVVETAQIDPNSKQQQAIFSASTHFSPVDFVCGVRDWQGNSFDLRQYVDEKAVFISKKSRGGKELKALEHPGLWNGAMARWITVFVEVPIITFNPVKIANDLLRKEHQPD